MSHGLEDQHLLVTGGATEIGLAATAAFVADGARQRGVTPAQVVEEYVDETEPTSLIRRLIAPEEVAASILHLAASPALNGLAMRAEGGTIRSIL